MAIERNQGGHRLRIGRCSLPNHIYHVTTVTTDRAKLFGNFVLGRMVVRSLMRAEDSKRVRSLAFVVMPDHLHWLVQLSADDSLSATVGSVKSQSSRLIRQAIGIENAVWQKGFYDRAIRHDDDLLDVARYIIANPLRGGLVDSIGNYPLWDSIWV